MPIDTNKANKLIAEKRCQELGVDEFFVDWEATYHRKPEEVGGYWSKSLFTTPINRSKPLYAPVVRWRIGEKWFTAAIPIETKTEYKGNAFAETSITDIDYEAMVPKLKELVEESRWLLI